jgi:uncharacterized protein (DUF362 family)
VETRTKPRVFIGDLSDGYKDALRRGFDYLGSSLKLAPSDKVVIKPNLTFPEYRPGVMTSPELIEELVVLLKNFTSHVTVCEADSGGYNRFSMDEVFRQTGLTDMARRLDIGLVNLSGRPSRMIPVQAGRREITVPLPRLVVDDSDAFFTVPVFKMHLNTTVSVAIKNQWGIIAEPSLRLRLHPYFKYVIHAVNRHLPQPYVVVDGKYGLDRSGPMRGDAIPLNCLAVADNIFATDLVACSLMGQRWSRISYLKHILPREGVTSLNDIDLSRNPTEVARIKFHLERKWTDYPGVVCFNSRVSAYIGYRSPLASGLHWLLYKFRQPFY